MKAVIIDDEKHCREVLTTLIGKYCPDLKIVKTFSSGDEALTSISGIDPDILFLDIEMPGMNGFEFLERCEEKNFEIIFTTAYNEYAIKAIRHSALDYLLKPIDKDELVTAVEKAGRQQARKTSSRVEQLLSSLHLKKESKRFGVPTLEGLIMLNSEEILYCESEGPYCTFYFTSETKKPLLTSRTLKEAEEVLQGGGDFFRVHHSYLINLKFVQKYIRGEGGEVIMNNGKNIPVARSRKQDFLKVLEKM